MKTLNFPEFVYCKQFSYAAGLPPNPSFDSDKYGPNTAIVDSSAIEALDRVIYGGIQSWEDIEQAERTVRAFILHENFYWLHPAILVVEPIPVHGGENQILAKESGKIVGPDYRKEFQISDTINKGGGLYYQAWNDGIYIDGIKLIEGSDYWKDKLEIIQSSNEDKLRKLFNSQLTIPYYKHLHLMSAKAIGAGAYFGLKNDREFESKITRDISSIIPERIFNKLDESWYTDVAGNEFGLNIRLGPFLATVLSKAGSRGNIPTILLDLRSDFHNARKELWEIFNSITYEKRMVVAIRESQKLSSAINSVIPASFPKKTRPFSFLWNAAFALKDIVENGGLISGVKFIGDTLLQHDVNWAQVSTVQATKSLTQSFKGIDVTLPQLLRKHITEVELNKLGLK